LSDCTLLVESSKPRSTRALLLSCTRALTQQTSAQCQPLTREKQPTQCIAQVEWLLRMVTQASCWQPLHCLCSLMRLLKPLALQLIKLLDTINWRLLAQPAADPAGVAGACP